MDDAKSIPKSLFPRKPLSMRFKPHYIRLVGLTDYGDKLPVK